MIINFNQHYVTYVYPPPKKKGLHVLILRGITHRNNQINFFTNFSTLLFWSKYRKVQVSDIQYCIVYIWGFPEIGTYMHISLCESALYYRITTKYRCRHVPNYIVFVCLNNTKAYRICCVNKRLIFFTMHVKICF